MQRKERNHVKIERLKFEGKNEDEGSIKQQATRIGRYKS